MDYLAELKYTSTGELAMTGQSDRKGGAELRVP